MNIDFDRICKLAGVSNGSSRTVLREGKEEEEKEDLKKEMYEDMEEGDYMHEEEDADEGRYMHEEEEKEDEEDQDEMVEVDVSELMSEIRRAKRIMKENKQRQLRNASRKKRLQETKLKRVIAQEVQNVLAEMDEHDSTWVYGKKKPRHSRKGYSNQGRMIPGVGFNF